jgi:hypothetical protein
MLRWQAAAALAAVTLATGGAYFYCWLKSANTAAKAEVELATVGDRMAPGNYELELPATI